MWEQIIKINPRMIVRLSRKGIDEKLFALAVQRGYKITEKDLQENELFCKSDFVMKEAIKVNPDFIRYYRGVNKFSFIKDLVKNGHPEAIRYLEDDNISFFYDVEQVELLILEALDNYHPSLDEIKRHEKWCESEKIMAKLIEQDCNAIKYIHCSHYGFKRLDQLALEHSFHPTFEDIKNNEYLYDSDAFFEIIIQEVTDVEELSEIIRYYHGKSTDIIQLAIDKGYKPSKEDIIKNEDIRRLDLIMKPLIEEDPLTIFLYEGNNNELFKIAYDLISDKSVIKERIRNREQYPYCNLRRNDFIMKKLIEEDCNFIEYYTGYNIDYFKMAFRNGYYPTAEFEERKKNDSDVFALCLEAKVKKGYIPTEKEMETMKSSRYVNVNDCVTILIDAKPEYIKYYTDDDNEVCWKAIRAGYAPSKESIKAFSCHDKVDILIAIVKLDSELLDLCIKDCTDDNKITVKVLGTGYIPSLEELESSSAKITNYEVMKKLLAINHDYIKYIGYIENKETMIELYEEASDSECIFEMARRDEHSYMLESDKIMEILIQRDSSFIRKYRGNNLKFFQLAISHDYEPTNARVFSYKPDQTIENENDLIILLLKTKDFSIIKDKERVIAQDYLRLFKVAVDMGYIPSLDNVTAKNFNLINEEIFKQIIDSVDRERCIDFLVRMDFREIDIYNEKIGYIIKSKNIDMPREYFSIINYYRNDKKLFLNHYDEFRKFLISLSIEESVFAQYTFCSDYDWLSDMITITENGTINDFNRIKEYFLKEYYQKENPDMNNAMQIKAFTNILKNYVKYPELCNYIVSNNIELTPEIIEILDFLFESNEILLLEDRPKTIHDLENIEEVFARIHLRELSDMKLEDIEEIKDFICRQLFNTTLIKTKELLSIYGNTEVLRQLLFDNRENQELHSQIEEMMIYTSMMEAIILADDKEYLLEMSKRIIDNYQLSTKCMILFTRFDEKMQSLYSRELVTNLTRLKDDISLKPVLDSEMSERLGIDVIDFSDREYCLLTHAKSESETIEQLILGEASGSMNFISLSAISYRNQVYYGSSIIFGYDSLPEGSFILSSISNMGSNSSVSRNSLDVSDISDRQQRGALQTSSAPNGSNSEILCFREGVRPRYIILPNGREPTEEEIAIAKQYGLKFVKTQGIGKSIEHPQKISEELLKPREEVLESTSTLDSLRSLKSALITSKPGPRRIAIFTDAHALFEPTLAILEDARKNGITEIYSLGDNIGSGPNPRQVVELLDEYGVQSLAGNHELYTTLGIESFREHLESTGALAEAKRNSSWTRTQLTPEQLDRLRRLPEELTIEIGGEKVLLRHYVADYNSGVQISIPNDISQVFQGHIHFAKEDGKISTIRGAGIGNQSTEHVAYYVVLTERDDGGFDIERRKIPYDYHSLEYDIMLSDMFDEDREKIADWSGVKK